MSCRPLVCHPRRSSCSLWVLFLKKKSWIFWLPSSVFSEYCEPKKTLCCSMIGFQCWGHNPCPGRCRRMSFRQNCRILAPLPDSQDLRKWHFLHMWLFSLPATLACCRHRLPGQSHRDYWRRRQHWILAILDPWSAHCCLSSGKPEKACYGQWWCW